MTELELTNRERMLVVSTAVVAFVAGLWVGVWSVPDRALDVPREFVAPGDGPAPIAYKPVPTWLMPTSLVAFVALAWWLYHQLTDGEIEQEPLELEDPTDD